MEPARLMALAAAIVVIVATIAYIDFSSPSSPLRAAGSGIAGALSGSQAAPEFAGITGYINAPENFTLASLRGHVVLVDFWTYSCINCIRTFPYLESWNEKYSGDGLVIVGVHTPEFAFEKNYANVLAAVQRFGIKYPVLLDSNHATWDAYQNEYWPRDYLVDANGNVRFNHVGEGGYGETEAQIVQLLSEAKNATVQVNTTAAAVPPVDFGKIGTPEIYLGGDTRRAPLGNANQFSAGQIGNFTIPSQLVPSEPYLEGTWQSASDAVMLNSKSGAFELQFTAKQVDVVSSASPGSTLRVFIDGMPAPAGQDGECAGACSITSPRLYSIVSLPSYGTHTLRAEVSGSGFELYTFTFG